MCYRLLVQQWIKCIIFTKEGNKFTNEQSKTSINALPRFKTLSAKELKSLFARAQNQEQEAINKLCGFYQSLIKKEAGRYYIYKALGEDAINIAWVIFLNFIQHYQGDDFKHLPGLIQYHLHYELLHRVQKDGRSWVKEIASEELMEMQAPEQLDQPLEKLAIRQELANLSPHQRDVLEMYYHQNKTNEQIAKHFGCSISTIKRQKLEALTNLKAKLNH